MNKLAGKYAEYLAPKYIIAVLVLLCFAYIIYSILSDKKLMYDACINFYKAVSAIPGILESGAPFSSRCSGLR